MNVINTTIHYSLIGSIEKIDNPNYKSKKYNKLTTTYYDDGVADIIIEPYYKVDDDKYYCKNCCQFVTKECLSKDKYGLCKPCFTIIRREYNAKCKKNSHMKVLKN